MVTLYRNMKFYEAGRRAFANGTEPRELFALARATEDNNPADPVKAESLMMGFWDAAFERIRALDPNPKTVLSSPNSQGSPNGAS